MAISDPSSDSPAPGEPSVPAEKGRPSEPVQARIDGLCGAFAVLRAQLASVNCTTAEAARGIVAQTTAVQEQLRTLIGVLEQEAARILSSSVEERVRIAEEEAAVLLLQRFLDRSSEHAREGEERARRIQSAVAEAGPLLAELRDLARQAKIVANNASVEAVRKEHGPFRVLAEAMRHVSERSAAAVGQVEGAITRVATGSQETRRVQEQDAADRPQLLRFAELVAKRATEQRAAEEQRQRMLVDVARQHDELHGRVVELFAMTQFQDVCGQQVEGVRAALANAEAVIRGLAGAMSPGAAAVELADALDPTLLLATYVMASQREAHAAATGETAGRDDQQRIELF